MYLQNRTSSPRHPPPRLGKRLQFSFKSWNKYQVSDWELPLWLHSVAGWSLHLKVTVGMLNIRVLRSDSGRGYEGGSFFNVQLWLPTSHILKHVLKKSSFLFSVFFFCSRGICPLQFIYWNYLFICHRVAYFQIDAFVVLFIGFIAPMFYYFCLSCPHSDLSGEWNAPIPVFLMFIFLKCKHVAS